MKLGTETGSVMNNIFSRATIGQPKPVVGMGATLLGWTDCNAATITKVTEYCGKVYRYEIEVTEDKSTVISGSTQDGSADYAYETRPDGYPMTYAFAIKTGEWVKVARNPDTGRLIKTGGNGLRIGERDTYRDPSF